MRDILATSGIVVDENVSVVSDNIGRNSDPRLIENEFSGLMDKYEEAAGGTEVVVILVSSNTDVTPLISTAPAIDPLRRALLRVK